MRKIKVLNKQKIKAPADVVLSTITNCREWPKFIPTVVKIEILEERGTYTKRKLYSRINGVIAKMVTETNYAPQENRLYYKQTTTPWPLKTNEGFWEVCQISEEFTEVVLVHIFEVKYSIWGYLLGLLIIKPLFIYLHNRKDLRLYKNYIESHVQDKSVDRD